jgi:AcrR family transcriptional regulator
MSKTTQPVRKPGLRERKKQRTRQTILDVALDLFAERGYSHTTLEQIADAAEISTGTLFAYFPSKEDILFPDERRFYEELERQLENRTAQTTTLDVLREVLANLEPPDEKLKLRWKILKEEGLAGHQRPQPSRVTQLLTESLATDLDSTTDDLRAILLAATISTALVTVGERMFPDSGPAITYQYALAILENMFTALQTGLTGMQANHDQPRTRQIPPVTVAHRQSTIGRTACAEPRAAAAPAADDA